MPNPKQKIWLLVKLAVVLVYFVALHRCTGFSILAERNNVVSTNNGTVINNKTVVPLFEGSDFGVTFVFGVIGTDGITRTVNMEASPFFRDYVWDQWAYSPSSVRLRTSEICNVRDTIGYNSSLPTYLLPTPKNRQLLELRHDRKLLGFLDQLVAGATTFMCTGGFGYLQSFVSTGLAVARASGNNVCGTGGIDQDMLADLKGDYENLERKTNNLLNAQEIFIGNLTTTIGSVIALNAQLVQYTEANQRATMALQAQINATREAIGVIATALTKQMGVIAGQIQSTNQAIIDLKATVIVGLSGQTLALAQNVQVLMDLINATNIQVSLLANNMSTQLQALIKASRAAARNTRNLASNLQQALLGTSVSVAQTLNMQEFISTAIANGKAAFLSSLGASGEANPQNLGPFATLPINTLSKAYTYINPLDNQPWAVLTTPMYTCSSLWFVIYQYTASTWNDMSEFIGPPGCSTTQEGPSFCNCYMSFKEQQCPIIRSAPGVADETVYQAFRANRYAETSTGLAAVTEINPDYCLGGQGAIIDTSPFTIPSGVDGVRITSLQGYINQTQLYAARGTCSNAAGGSSCTKRGYSGWDISGRQQAQIEDDPAVARGEFTESMMGSVANLFVVDMNWLTLQYQYVLTFAQTYTGVVFGIPPVGQTQSKVIRTDPASGNPLDCSRWTFAELDPNPSTGWVPVNVMRPTAIRGTVTVTVDGQSNVGMTYVLSNPNTQLLPDYRVFMGDPLSTTIQYNPADDQIVISPTAEIRKGTLVYIAFGDTSDLTLPMWEAINQAIFDQEAAGNSLDNYLNFIDPLTGLCIHQSTNNVTVFNMGTYCFMREVFLVSPNPSGGFVSYIGLNDQLIAEVTFPEGQIVGFQVSSCPQVAPPVITQSGQTQLTLTNLVGGSLPNQITYITTGACSSAQSGQVNINPLDTATILIPYCAANPPGVFPTTSFYYLLDNQLTLCPNFFNLTASPQSLGTFQGAGTMQTTETLRNLTTDYTLMSISSALTGLNSLLLMLNNNFMNVISYQGVPQSQYQAVVANNTEFLRLARQVQDLATQNIVSSQQNTVDYNQLIAPFNQRLADNERLFAAAWSDAQISSQNAAVILNQTVANFAQLTRAAANYLNASAEYFEASLAFNRQVLRIFQSLGEDGDLSFIGDFFEALANAGEDVWEALLSIPPAVADFFGTTLGGLLNSTVGGIFTFIGIILAFGAAALSIGYIIYQQCSAKPPVRTDAKTGGRYGQMDDEDEDSESGKNANARIKSLENQISRLTTIVNRLVERAGIQIDDVNSDGSGDEKSDS